jgi:hypothetical protein
MNKLKEMKDLIEDLKDCVDGNGVPNIHYISNRIADLDKVVNTINYIPCCEELNPDFEIGEQVLLTKRTIVTIETFCEDGMIEIDDNNEYYKVDKDELTKRV